MKRPRIYSKARTALSICLAWFLYVLSHLMPKSQKIWIFIGCRKGPEREYFADNAKYMFLHAAQKVPEVTSVWISPDKKLPKILRERGYKSYFLYSPWGIWYSLRANYTFVDAFIQMSNWQWSGRSKVIQLWHGKGMKKTAHESPYSLPAYNKIASPHLFRRYKYVIATSEYTSKMMSQVFRVPMEQVLLTGLPRHDSMFEKIKDSELDNIPGLEEKVKLLRSQGAEKIVFYAPTFRPNDTNPLFEHLKSGVDKFQLDLDALEDLFGRMNSHLFISLHPKFSLDNYGVDKYRHITFLPSGLDIYPTLPLFDLLITDYSSIFADFLLVNKPMIFLVYDLERYRVEMGLFEEFEEMTPGPKVFTNEELHTELKKVLQGTDEHREHREKIMKIFYKNLDGHSAQRIANHLTNR